MKTRTAQRKAFGGSTRVGLLIDAGLLSAGLMGEAGIVPDRGPRLPGAGVLACRCIPVRPSRTGRQSPCSPSSRSTTRTTSSAATRASTCSRRSPARQDGVVARSQVADLSVGGMFIDLCQTPFAAGSRVTARFALRAGEPRLALEAEVHYVQERIGMGRPLREPRGPRAGPDRRLRRRGHAPEGPGRAPAPQERPGLRRGADPAAGRADPRPGLRRAHEHRHAEQARGLPALRVRRSTWG